MCLPQVTHSLALRACITLAIMKTNGPKSAEWTIALAHGAGANMDSEFMEYFATELAGRGLRVVRFEFPYMIRRRETGKSRPPDREPVLKASWMETIDALGNERLVIGGKSMGGRIASLVADEANVAGLVCLGYPFHPTGKPDRLRVEQLRDLQTPTLILQGERDAFGNRTEVPGIELSKSIRVKWLVEGDHSFKPRKASGKTREDNWDEAIAEIVSFAKSLDA